MRSLARFAVGGCVALALFVVGVVVTRAAPNPPAEKSSRPPSPSLSSPSSPSGPSWSYVVALDPATGIAEVDLTVLHAPKPFRVCADMHDSSRAVVKIEQPTPSGPRAVPVDREDHDCFLPRTSSESTLTLHYRSSLDRLASGWGDPDRAAHFGPDYVFSDEAVLLRPDPLPEDAPITVEFRLPKKSSVAVPWRRLPATDAKDARDATADTTFRFATDSTQFDAGTYIAAGKLVELGEFPVKDGRVRITTFDQPHKATGAELSTWVRTALGVIADFYGTLPGGLVHVILAPIQGNPSSGIFGTVFRRGTPSVTLLFGAEAPGASFAGEWVAFHEFFHIGNPRISGRIPWFIEGFTTYYANVVRARTGARPATEMCGEFLSEFDRYCQPDGGRSLADDNRIAHNYSRIYWGGACLAFRLDAAIRIRTKGKRSLDDVLRELRASGETYDEDELVTIFDREAGGHLASEHLKSKKRLPLKELEQRLGMVPDGENAALRDDAPEAAIRRAMFGR